LPAFGTVGMHVLGFPRRWIEPPYEWQGLRLLTRFDELRAQIDQRNPRWSDRIAEANLAFRTQGVLPEDDVVRGLVLADVELDAHRANGDGHDVKEVMGWFDQAARGDDDERVEAQRLLSEAAKSGRLRWARE
jgi:hypothetical protein